MTERPWRVQRGDDPILATAIHAGHGLRPEVQLEMLLPEDDRLREEDPFTDIWTSCAENSIVVDSSRFELDINRPRDKAIYRRPEDAWGLEVWKDELSDELVDDSLAIYDAFYDELAAICDELLENHGRFVVLDLHSYNHRRGGPDAGVDDPALNPEINLGTESADPAWRPVIDVFADALRRVPYDDGSLDVRENVKFKGGAMTRWMNARYGDQGCSIAVEAKKIFMNEWTGIPDEAALANLDQIIRAAAGAVRTALDT